MNLPVELHPVVEELRKDIRSSRDDLPRVMTWFNLNKGTEHYYVLRRGRGRIHYVDFYSLDLFVAWCRRNQIDRVALTRVSYENERITVEDLRKGL